MRTTATWAFIRRLQYGAFFSVVTIGFFVLLYSTFIYTAPTCFDNTKNEGETGVDCGGVCTRICAFEVVPPQVQWARSFKITDGQYNAVAYIENTNRVASTPELHYTFSLFDEAGLIVERQGTTILPPDSVYPVFEGRLFTGDRVPTRTLLDIETPDLWLPSETGRDQFTILDRNLSGADAQPKLDAVVKNESLEEAREVEVVATIFNAHGTALTASQTFVDNFDSRSVADIVFTWPEPIAKTVRSCEVPTDVVVAIDLSGSMNNDGDNPPEPITTVLESAEQFVSRLGENDQVSVVTFATDAEVSASLSGNIPFTASVVKGLAIDPSEEVGNTNTGEAFVRATEELTSFRHNIDARKVMVLLTDGLATAPGEEPELYAQEQAALLKSNGVEVYTIGLGESVNMDFVRTVATAPSYAYQALTRNDIDTIYREITGAICEDGAAVIDIVPKSDAGFIYLDE